MAQFIQAVRELGPRIAPMPATEADEVLEEVVMRTSQSRGTVLSSLSELDVTIVRDLRRGRPVKLPNGTTLKPVMKLDGTISIKVYLSPEIVKAVNRDFQGKVINAANIGATKADIIAQWNELHPEDPISLTDADNSNGTTAPTNGTESVAQPVADGSDTQ